MCLYLIWTLCSKQKWFFKRSSRKDKGNMSKKVQTFVQLPSFLESSFGWIQSHWNLISSLIHQWPRKVKQQNWVLSLLWLFKTEHQQTCVGVVGAVGAVVVVVIAIRFFLEKSESLINLRGNCVQSFSRKRCTAVLRRHIGQGPNWVLFTASGFSSGYAEANPNLCDPQRTKLDLKSAFL